MRGGDRRATSRVVTELERLLRTCRPCCGSWSRTWVTPWWLGSRARRAPASRRSSTPIRSHLRQAGKSVGIIAVDPSSPVSGGAILGDRIRMTGDAR